MENSKEEIFKGKLNKFVAYSGILFALLIFPKVFQKFFAMGDLRGKEIAWLYVLFIVFISISVFIFLKRKKINVSRSLIFFSLLLMIGIELIVRFYCHFFTSKERVDLLRQESNWTYPENTAYVGHPFLQFVGKPNVLLHGSKAFSGSTPFNNFGFTGADFHYPKPDHFIRIACVGESTTAEGWPFFLENYLNDYRTNPYCRYEVMNFAHAFWTSAHSTVNVVLNIIDFKPDYLIIHHGWNENHEREFDPKIFRGDYFHDLKSFSLPEIYDRYPIRISVIYRLIKFKYDQAPSWMSMDRQLHTDHDAPLKYENLDELKPYRRNIETMITNALMHKIKVIVTTIPHSRDNAVALWYSVKSLDQCNQINREVAAKFKSDSVTFVDLDKMIDGKHNDIFVDLAHTNDNGKKLKAKLIGEELIMETKAREHFISSLPYLDTDHENDLQFYEDRMKSNPDWLNDLSKKSKEKNIPLDSVMKADAGYMIYDEQKKMSVLKKQQDVNESQSQLSVREKIIEQYVHNIISDKKWYSSVSEKAKEKDVSIDVMLRMDAEYMMTEDSTKKK